MAIGTALGWGNWATVALAVVLAFVFGYLLTLVPLLRAGTEFGAALAPGDHIALLYETDEESRAAVSTFVREGIEAGDKVLYLSDAGSEEVLRLLGGEGLNTGAGLMSGQLDIRSAEDSYVGGGSFEPDRMVAFTVNPAERPYSAAKLLVLTLNSWTASGLGRMSLAFPSRSTLATPSRRKLLASSRWPCT